VANEHGLVHIVERIIHEINRFRGVGRFRGLVLRVVCLCDDRVVVVVPRVPALAALLLLLLSEGSIHEFRIFRGAARFQGFGLAGLLCDGLAL
jgi:hypothetical protein